MRWIALAVLIGIPLLVALPALLEEIGEWWQRLGKEGMMHNLIPVRFWTRRCRGCADESPHDSHLTWFGRLALGILRG